MGDAARARARHGGVVADDEAEESDESEDDGAGERTTRVGRPRGGMKVAARIGERLRSCCEEREEEVDAQVRA